MSENAKKYDLTRKMSPYFDIHMVIPLLDFLCEVKLYDAKDITNEKITSVLKTNMIEVVEDEYQKFADDKEMSAAYAAQKDEMERKKEVIFDQLDHEPEDVQKVREFFQNEALIAELKSSGNLTIENLTTTHAITLEDLESYCRHGKFKYECGIYIEGIFIVYEYIFLFYKYVYFNVQKYPFPAADMLGNYLSVVQSQSNSVLGALWGRLSCRILQASWEESALDFIAVKEAIESRSIAPMDQVR